MCFSSGSSLPLLESRHFEAHSDGNVCGLVCRFSTSFILILDPLQVQSNYTQPFQFCGGYLDPVDYSPRPYITASGAPSPEDPKGFLCPVQSLCVVANSFNDC